MRITVFQVEPETLRESQVFMHTSLATEFNNLSELYVWLYSKASTIERGRFRTEQEQCGSSNSETMMIGPGSTIHLIPTSDHSNR